jgi:hypothetical protein
LTVKGLEKNVANIFGETPIDLVKDAEMKKMMKGNEMILFFFFFGDVLFVFNFVYLLCI